MTLDQIARLRTDQLWPNDAFVTLWLDCEYAARNDKPEVSIDSAMPIRLVDARTLVGLAVAIHANEYSDRLVRLVERVKEHAAFVLVAVASFGDELGWKWSRLHGDMEL